MIEDNSRGTDVPEQDSEQEQPDPIKNIKAEFARKQGNTDAVLQSLKAQLDQITEAVIASTSSKKAQAEDEELPDPVIDPKGYKNALIKQARAEISSTIQHEDQRRGMLSQLVTQYPELQSADNDLTQRAVQIYNSLSQQEKNMPSSYKLAVSEAAQELGVLPMNKRKSNATSDESFTVSSSSGSSGGASRKAGKKEELDPRTVEFARLLGKDPSDPKYLEKLKTAAKLTNWKKQR